MLTVCDAQDVAVPVAEPNRGRQVGPSLGLFQPHEQLACAPENDHRIDSVIHITMRGTIARASRADLRRDSAPASAGLTDKDSVNDPGAAAWAAPAAPCRGRSRAVSDAGRCPARTKARQR